MPENRAASRYNASLTQTRRESIKPAVATMLVEAAAALATLWGDPPGIANRTGKATEVIRPSLAPQPFLGGPGT